MAYKRNSPIPVVEGGTGAQTITGVLIGNGASAVTGNAVTQHDVLVGGASNAISSIAPSGTSGVPLVSAGAASNPAFGTAVVAGGGTGATTLTGVLIGSGTSAITGNAVTQHDVLIGGASNAITSVAPSATSGVALVSAGASSDPAFGTVVVAGGGTGDTSFTAYAPIFGGTTTTGALQSSATGITNSGYVLTSTGGTSLPTFQAAPAGSVTITGDTGGGLTGSSFTFTGASTGLTFDGSGSTETLGGTLVVANGGTGDASFTEYSVVCGGTSTTGALQAASTGQSNSGYVLTSTGSSSLPTWQASGGGGSSFTWTATNSATISMTTNNGYILTTVFGTTPLTTFTLPATSSVGDILEIVTTDISGSFGGANSGFQINQNAGQNILGIPAGGTPLSTTVGTGGHLYSTTAGIVHGQTPGPVGIQMVCAVANTTWVVKGGNIGVADENDTEVYYALD